jgi:hypothetical protein
MGLTIGIGVGIPKNPPVASGEPTPVVPAFALFNDDAKTAQYFTDDAKTKPLVTKDL